MIAVLFGLLIIFALVAGCTAVSGRFPRTTAAFTLLLWIMTGIFFILGSGMISVISDDVATLLAQKGTKPSRLSCSLQVLAQDLGLYAETALCMIMFCPSIVALKCIVRHVTILLQFF